MMGLKFRGQIPFRHVFINGLVRDLKRRKMSKSEGNIIDPLEMIEKYGTDALRFTLAALAVPGMDLSLSEERMAGYQAFANKIWNASRFVLMNLGRAGRPGSARSELTLADRWIRSRLAAVTGSVTRSLEQYKFYEAAETPSITSSGTSSATGTSSWPRSGCEKATGRRRPSWPTRSTGSCASSTRSCPSSPRRSGNTCRAPAARSPWPPSPRPAKDGGIARRRTRHVPPSGGRGRGPQDQDREQDPAQSEAGSLGQGCRCRPRPERSPLNPPPSKRWPGSRRSSSSTAFPAGKRILKGVAGPFELAIPLDDTADLAQEKERLERELQKIRADIAKLEEKLGNGDFVSKAPQAVVDENRTRLEGLRDRRDKVEKNLSHLPPSA